MSRIQVLMVACIISLLVGACDSPPAEQAPAETDEQAAAQQEEASQPAGSKEAAGARESGQESDQSAQEEGAGQSGDIERSLLWRVDGGQGPVWLFGTIHGGVDASQWEGLPEEVRQAIDAAEMVVLEIDIEKMEDPAIQQDLMGRIMLPEGQSLRDELGEERWEKLSAIAPLPPTVLERFQPWMVYSLLTETMLPDEEAVDVSIQGYAKERDKELAYLEEIEEQLDMLAEGVDIAVLGDAIDRYDEYEAITLEMIEKYKQGDEQALEALLYDPEMMEVSPEFFELLLAERNSNWMASFEDYLERGNVFVAAGVGHYLGEDSVIASLREAGYEVERVE